MCGSDGFGSATWPHPPVLVAAGQSKSLQSHVFAVRFAQLIGQTKNRVMLPGVHDRWIVMALRRMFAVTLWVAISMPGIASAENDWKKGRVYYRMVCSSCHIEQAGEAIAPSNRTIAEWKAYIAADKHAKGRDSLRYYVSQSYRESIKTTNKAAAKFIDEPDNTMLSNVTAFVVRGAKDGDVPAKCN